MYTMFEPPLQAGNAKLTKKNGFCEAGRHYTLLVGSGVAKKYVKRGSGSF